MDQRHVPPLGALFLSQLAVHVLDHVVVFRVDEQHRAQPLNRLHQVMQVTRAHHPGFPGHGRRADIGGENLDAGESILNMLG